MTHLTINSRLAQWFVEAIGRLLATFAIALGIAIITGGRARWENTSYQTALLVPGAPGTWGWAVLALGSLALAGSLLGRYTPVVIGMMGCGIWSLFFTISFIISSLTISNASNTAPWVYATMSILYLLLAVIYRMSRKITRSWRVALYSDYEGK